MSKGDLALVKPAESGQAEEACNPHELQHHDEHGSTLLEEAHLQQCEDDGTHHEDWELLAQLSELRDHARDDWGVGAGRSEF